MPASDTGPANNRNRSIRLCQAAAWSLSAAVSLAALITWGHDYQWRILPINNYLLFPLLGLLAFSLMWAHYIASVLRQAWGLERSVLRQYFETTSLVVLVLLCMHPSLLIYQRFRDGYGLPPGSYESYVAPGMAWITLLGTASLIIFVAYEFRRIYGGKSWWRFVAAAGDVAMLAIVYHGLRLGSQLQTGWYRYLWWFYAITLVLVLINKYFRRYFTGQAKPSQIRIKQN